MPPTEAGVPPSPAARSGSSRSAPVVLLAVAGLLLAARVVLGIVEHARPIERADLVEWRHPGAGDAEARATGKLVLYCFTEEGSDACRRLIREVFGDPRTAATINQQFIPVRVLDLKREEGRNTPDVEGLELKFGVRRLPTLVVATPDGSRSEKHAGYAGPLLTRQFLSQASAMAIMPGRGRLRAQPESGAGAAAPDTGVSSPADSAGAR